MRPWSLFDVASNVNGSAIGSGQTQQYSLAQFAFLTNGNDSFTNATSNSSFLSTIEPRYWLNYTFNSAAQKLTVNGFQKVPYFQSTDGENLDDKLGSAIRATIAQLASIDKSIFDSTNPKNTDLTAYFNTVSQILAQTPYGCKFQYHPLLNVTSLSPTYF